MKIEDFVYLLIINKIKNNTLYIYKTMIYYNYYYYKLKYQHDKVINTYLSI